MCVAMAANVNDSTLKPNARSTVGGVPRIVPALTILWHPDLSRVGELAVLEELTTQKTVSVSRLAPLFQRAGTTATRDLEDLYLSRSPAFQLVPGVRGQVELRPGSAASDVEVQGAELTKPMMITPAEIESGVVISLSRVFALCLHNVELPLEHGPTLDLVGSGQRLERVRQDVRRVGDLDVPVLIRGETGTGKELIARSIVACSKRAHKPFIAVNMATIPPSVAASELFGHEKGAFTGASAARSGYFGEAAGGTLFLDEVGLTPVDVQAMLLRVLETGEIQSVGAGKARKLDVRILAATDLQLESAISKHAFSEPLFQRLAGFQIRIPPLRKRREDFGELVLHFLKEELAVIGELHRLGPPDEDRKPWLSAAKIARLAIGHWSGNVRALRNAVRQIVIASRGQSRARIDAEVEELADGSLGAQARSDVSSSGSIRAVFDAPARASKNEGPASGFFRAAGSGNSSEDTESLDVPGDAVPWDISNDVLLETLRQNNWSPTHTAAALKIPRTKLYALMDRHPDIRKASAVPVADLLRLHRETRGDLDQMANQLRVSRRGLQLRMSQLAPAGPKPPTDRQA
jgi:two-component system nitrogen regulation response regulator GlnG